MFQAKWSTSCPHSSASDDIWPSSRELVQHCRNSDWLLPNAKILDMLIHVYNKLPPGYACLVNQNSAKNVMQFRHVKQNKIWPKKDPRKQVSMLCGCHSWCWLIDWVKVLHPTSHKIGNFSDVPQAYLLAWYGKTKSNTTNAYIHQSKEMYYNTK